MNVRVHVVPPSVEQLDSAFYTVLGSRVYEVLNAVDAGLPLRLARCAADWVNTDPEVIAVYDEVFLEGRDFTKAEMRAIDAQFSKRFGLDAPTQAEVKATVQYEIVGVDPEAMT